jgi:hypothetical protein
VRPEGLGQFKNPPHRDANPRLSGLQHSALTITLPRAPASVIKRRDKVYLYTLASIINADVTDVRLLSSGMLTQNIL